MARSSSAPDPSGAANTLGGALPPGAPSLQSLVDAAGGALTRLQRYVQAPPPGFPPGPPGDQSLAMLAGPLDFISRLRREHGPVVGLLLGGERAVLVSDPTAARQVLVDQPDVFVKEGTAFFPGSSLTGNGLLVSDGDVWRRQRRMANPAFRKAAVDRYAEEMAAATRALLDGPVAASADAATGAGAGGVRDLYQDFNQLTLNITLAALFGIRGGDEEGGGRAGGATAASVVAAVERAFSYFAARGAAAMVVPEWVPTPDNRSFQEAVQQLDDLVYGIIDARRRQQGRQQQQGQQQQEQQQQQQHGAPDLLQALLDSTDESGRPMARSALRDELMTLLVAGQETSAILLGWAAALLAHNPRAQAAAAAEVAAVLGGEAPAAADAARLPVVTAVVLEALRLYSPAYMVGRCARRDVQLATGSGSFQLPAGTTLLVSPWLLHREPGRWRQPALFRPERWLPLLAGQQQPGQQGHQQQQPQASGSESSGGGACPFDHSSSGGGEGEASGSSGCPVDHTAAAGTAAAGAGAYSWVGLLRDLGPNGAFAPFGGGPRNCIGTGFAMTEAVVVLAMLMQRYELHPVTPAAGFPRPKPMLTLRPDGVPLRVVRRRRRQPPPPQQQQPQRRDGGASAEQAPAATAAAV